MEDGGIALRKFVAPECMFGRGARRMAANYAVKLGARKTLLVTDPGVMEAGWISEIEADLKSEDLPYVIYSGVSPNPRDEEVMAGAEFYLSEHCNSIVAVGGGSPMDCAKGIGIVCTNRRHILEFEGVDEVRVAIPPLICVPTTGGTSADVSQFAVISDPAKKRKIVIASKAIVPDVALIDPEVLTTMPFDLAANTGMDAFIHSFEAYVSNVRSEVTSHLALEAIRLICRHLRASMADPTDIDLKQKICIACIDSGFAFSNAGIGMIHGMAHSIGGLVDAPHGACNSIILPHVAAFNFPSVPERYIDIGQAMGLDIGKRDPEQEKAALFEGICLFQQSLGIPTTLSEVGVKENDLHGLAVNAMNDPCMATNPREPTFADVEEIYERAF